MRSRRNGRGSSRRFHAALNRCRPKTVRSGHLPAPCLAASVDSRLCTGSGECCVRMCDGTVGRHPPTRSRAQAHRLTLIDTQARRLARRIEAISDRLADPADAFKDRLTVGGLMVDLVSHVPNLPRQIWGEQSPRTVAPLGDRAVPSRIAGSFTNPRSVIRRHAAAAHHIERARMSSPLAAVRLSIASDGSSSTVDPSVDTSSPLRRHLSWMVSA